MRTCPMAMIVVICLSGVVAFGQDQETRALKWQMPTSADGQSHAWERACFSKDGKSILAIEKGIDKQGSVLNVSLSEISLKGDRVRHVQLFGDQIQQRYSPAVRPLIPAMAVTPNGILLVAYLESDYHASVVRLDHAWKLVSSERLPESLSGAIFLTSVTLPDGLLLLGSNGPAAIVAKLDLKGGVDWTRAFTREGRMNVISDAVLSRDGKDLHLAGHSGVTNKLGFGPQDVWMIKATVDGKERHEQFFPGRRPVLAGPFEDGNLAILYDTETLFDTRNRLRIVDPEFKQVSDTPIETGSHVTIHRPSLAMSGKNRFLMGGDAKLVEYDSAGKPIGKLGANLPFHQSSLVLNESGILVVGNQNETSDPSLGILFFIR